MPKDTYSGFNAVSVWPGVESLTVGFIDEVDARSSSWATATP